MSEPTESVPNFFMLLAGALLGVSIIGGLFYAANTSNVGDSEAAAILGALPSFTCGVSTVQDVDANVYDTIQVGAQCWMKQNMRVGTRIGGATTQTSNATIEKWCYGDSDANCTSDNPNEPDGGLYQWDEAMQYSTTTGAQGICPTGWHIPSHDEFTTLERAVCTSGSCATDFPYDTTTTGYRGTNEGTKLKSGGTSGLEFNLAGLGVSGSFFNRAAAGNFWSSTESGGGAWGRGVASITAQVGRATDNKSSGLSVRCLKDDPNPSGSTFTIANTVTSPGSSLEDGLVGHWTFDGMDMTNATATDVSGNGNHGTLSNSPTKAIGKLGQGLNFNGVNNTVILPNVAALKPTGSFAVSFWYKGLKGSAENFISHSPAALTNFWNIDDSSAIFCAAANCSKSTGDTYTLPNDNDWHHLAAVLDRAASPDTVTVYIDGISQGTATGTADSDITSYGTNTLIGGESWVNSGYRQGPMDDVRIYNRALSAEEVQRLHGLGQGSVVKICKVDSVQDADANTYNTLAIGSQCWLDRNMNVGTRISAATTQTNNATTEKYCYSDLDSNCNTNHPNKPDGGLYQWNEAMQYSTIDGAQGICPAGFHIPTDAEWHTLEKFLKDSGQSCDPARSAAYGCSPTGTKILNGGMTNFMANLPGYIQTGASSNRDNIGYYWSSTESSTNAWLNGLSSAQTGTLRDLRAKTYGATVRCVQD